MNRLFAALAVLLAMFVVHPASAAPAATWNGFYVGGHVGNSGGSDAWKDIQYPLGGCCGQGNDPGSGLINGIHAGVQAGFNWQMGNVVWGVEAALSSPEFKSSFLCFGNDYSAICSSRFNWLGTLSARAGFQLTNNVLFYGKVGVAMGDDRLHAVTNIYGDTYDASLSSRKGGLVGVGLEFASTNRLSMAVEFQHIWFSDRALFTPGIVNSFLGGFTWTSQINTEISRVTVGLNYHL